MRQVEREILEARGRRVSRTLGNTKITFSEDLGFYFVELHGNLIYYLKSRGIDWEIIFSFAKWDTSTTRSRLRTLGLPIRRNRHKLNCLWLGFNNTQRYIIDPDRVYRYSYDQITGFRLTELGEYPESKDERSRYFESNSRV